MEIITKSNNNNEPTFAAKVASENLGKFAGCHNLTHYSLNYEAIEKLGKEAMAALNSYLAYSISVEYSVREQADYIADIDANGEGYQEACDISDVLSMDWSDMDETHPYYVDFLLMQRDIQHLSHALDSFVTHIVNTYNVPKEEILVPLSFSDTIKKEREEQDKLLFPRFHDEDYLNNKFCTAINELRKAGVSFVDYEHIDEMIEPLYEYVDELKEAIDKNVDSVEDPEIKGLKFEDKIDIIKVYLALTRFINAYADAESLLREAEEMVA